MNINEQYLKLSEELETLRASNTIKQANIELLEAENAKLKLHKEYDQALDRLITERDSLLEENAKLIAERDELIHDRGMLKMCADHYEDDLKRMHAERDEVKKMPDCKFGDNLVWFLREFENAEKEYLEEGYLEIYGEDYNGREGSCEITVNEICGEAANVIENLLAEREAMMKQEPVATVSDWVGARAAKDKISLIVDVPAGFTFLRGQKLYAHPLPAQQEPAWRDLKHGELIQKGDRILRGKEWDSVLNLWIGEAYDANNFMKIQSQAALPAQQIPEGYALEWHDNHLIVTAPDNGQGLAYADETLYQFIKAMLSASQPKGDM